MDLKPEAMTDSKPGPEAVTNPPASLNATDVPPPPQDDPDTALEQLLSQIEPHFLIDRPLGHHSSRVKLLSSVFRRREHEFRRRYAQYLEQAGIFRSRTWIRLMVIALVVALIIFAVDEAFNQPTESRIGYLWLPTIVAVPMVLGQILLRLCGLDSGNAIISAVVQAFLKPSLLPIMSIYMKHSEPQNKAVISLLDLLNQSLTKWKQRAEVLEFSFASLTSTFDEVVASQKMLKAQNTALNVHIGRKSDAFFELSTQNAKLQQEVNEFRRFKNSTVNVVTTDALPKHDDVSSSLRHDAALAELALQRQQVDATREDANAMLEAANQKMTIVNELLEKAKQTQDEASVYAKETNEQCAELRETMRQSELLECERVTKLRKLAESRYGEGVLELEALEAAEGAEGEDSDGDGDGAKGKGKELGRLPSPPGAVLPPRRKQPQKPEAVLRGRYNTSLPAFRYSAGAPRMVTTGSRVDAVSRLNAGDYALAWPSSVRGVIQDASAEAKARAKRARKGAVEPKVSVGTAGGAPVKRGKGEVCRDRGKDRSGKVGKQGKRR